MHRSSLLPAIATFLLVLLMSSFLIAGIRGPGRYSGVVFFDRWGGCILFSGVYLMYISEEVKDSLRSYEGQAIGIDAQQVVQPLNPGDGLIKRFKIVGPARPKQAEYSVEGTRLQAEPADIRPPYASVTLTITNESSHAAKINSPQIGFGLLSQQPPDKFPESPSDGVAAAVITRTNVLNAHSSSEFRTNDRMISYSYTIADDDRLPVSFTLAPHESKKTKITFSLPNGSYEFLAGYGGGVHEDYLITSNPVSIDF